MRAWRPTTGWTSLAIVPMKKSPVLLPLVSLMCGLAAIQCRKSPPPPAVVPPVFTPAASSQPDYTTGPASPDGIGRFFHNREISQVMGHPAIGWLERENREDEEAPRKAIEALQLKPDAVIADIGAGSGYYSFRIAPKVPFGKVIAVDIQSEMLDFMKKRATDLKIPNVEPHLGAVDGLDLPDSTLDAALMVDAYHEFSEPAGMLTSLMHSLKPGGRIYLLEYRQEDPEVPIKRLHKMSEAQARLEFETAGFRFISNSDVLPWQHFLIFERPR